MMRSSDMRLLVRLVAFLLLACGLPARADTPVSLFQSFRGTVNFVGTEETLRTKDNRYPCRLVNGGIYAYLAGIPSGATIKSAQLYWAGSGTTADYNVVFDGVAISAPAGRRYSAKAVANNTTYTYFSGAADVTTQVSKKGNGYYTFSGLTVNNGEPWCSVQGVVGGFALAVVYSHPNEPFRMLNIYEGFQDFQYTSLRIDLGNFNVPNPLPANVTGRVGHITWEGDQTLSQGGEDLLFNGYEMTDKYPNSNTWFNPPGNQFNSASNVTGDATSYGIDFDIYTLRSPIIQPGQSTATTTYRSGQDMVILSAEIVAMPYVANADLALAMTRTGELSVGSLNTYTLTVSNGGVDAEMGPVKVVDTLPANLKFVSASGTGWTCSNVQSAGQTVVTCTQSGPVAPGAKMTPLIITATPTAAGNYTNTATVSGITGDDKLGNNTATNATGPISSGTAATYVFTSQACTAGQSMEIGDSNYCPAFNAPVTAAASSNIYVTYVTVVNGKRVATTPSGADASKSVDFKFSCLPNSGVAITYGGLSNFDCSGTSRTLTLKFPTNGPTATLSAAFLYKDIGRVSMAMLSGGTSLASVDFISKPSDMRFQSVFRADGTAEDERYGFVKAGEQFTMRVGALMADGNFAPSYGKEPSALKDVMADNPPVVIPVVDIFLLDASKNLPVPDTDEVTYDEVVSSAFAYDLEQKFALNTAVTGFGALDAPVRWYEAGSFAATPYLVNYLGTGQIGGPPSREDVKANPASRVVPGTRVIGRFYPDRFETTVELAPNMACPAAMNCPAVSTDPAKPTFPVNGAVYSSQPFNVTVTAFGLDRGSKKSQLTLFQNDSQRPVTLSAGKAPNDAAAPASAPAALSAKAFTPSSGAGDFQDMKVAASYSTGSPFSSASRGTPNWGAPTLVYLRASMTEKLAPGGTTTLAVTSRIADNTWTPQNEQGVLVLPGRLFVPNVFGSELLRLPVTLSVQYWNGKAWVVNPEDDFAQVASAVTPIANGCRRAFAQDPKLGTCIPNPLTIAGTTPTTVTDGKGTMILQAPARGTVGSVDYTVASSAAPWLPSTQARATFGLYRSPLIYLREVY
jgi:uncharacterized repeat protein (TIGR01451 family)